MAAKDQIEPPIAAEAAPPFWALIPQRARRKASGVLGTVLAGPANSPSTASAELLPFGNPCW